MFSRYNTYATSVLMVCGYISGNKMHELFIPPWKPEDRKVTPFTEQGDDAVHRRG